MSSSGAVFAAFFEIPSLFVYIFYKMTHLDKIKDLFVFNYDFKDAQLECFDLLIKNNDFLAVLPTSYGKSIIYQMAPYILFTKNCQDGIVDMKRINSLCLILTPLNSIIEDQLSSLCQKGIKACALDYSCEQAKTFSTEFSDSDSFSEASDDEFSSTMDSKGVPLHDIIDGKYQLVYAHPEALISTAKGRSLLGQMPVSAIAVDEAHMILEW